MAFIMGVSATTGVGFVADLPSMLVYVEEESSASGPSVGPRLKIHWNPNPALCIFMAERVLRIHIGASIRNTCCFV